MQHADVYVGKTIYQAVIRKLLSSCCNCCFKKKPTEQPDPRLNWTIIDVEARFVMLLYHYIMLITSHHYLPAHNDICHHLDRSTAKQQSRSTGFWEHLVPQPLPKANPFHPLSTTSDHFHPLSSHVHQLLTTSSTFNYFHPLSFIFNHLHQLSSKPNPFHPLSTISSTSIHLNPPQSTSTDPGKRPSRSLPPPQSHLENSLVTAAMRKPLPENSPVNPLYR